MIIYVTAPGLRALRPSSSWGGFFVMTVGADNISFVPRWQSGCSIPTAVLGPAFTTSAQYRVHRVRAWLSRISSSR